MTKQDDFLVEIHTEELPPKALKKMAEAFCQQIKERLQKAGLAFTDANYFATPRRLAVLVKKLQAAQPDQQVEKRGPALAAAFDAAGKPTLACEGFARSCGVTPDALMTLKTPQGEWVAYHQQVQGKQAIELLPAMVQEAVDTLPVPKRMRWSDKETQFSRPVQTVVMLYGDDVIEGEILGCQTGRVTHGHRFMATEVITIPTADAYESLLQTEGYVMADFNKRREKIAALAQAAVKALSPIAHPYITDVLLDEVTGLVEWPVALCGQFDETFLQVPKEVLISAMQDHQRYFPVMDKEDKLLPYFIATSNIESHDPKRVTHGNERVLRARLSDAAFFYVSDKKVTLASRLERLKGIVFQAKLGTLHDKTERLAALTVFLAAKTGGEKQAERAGRLAKTDLVTDMVGEFPELQGVMGGYYARHDGESEEVVVALQEQYLPRFAGDRLPASATGRALALADRLDTLAGTFGINQIPTGDKDPFGLRRAALGVLRICIEQKIELNLQEAIAYALSLYQVNLENKDACNQAVQFTLERLRAWYQDQGVTADVFASVAALGISHPLDIDRRIRAVQAFKQLVDAEALSVANKRVSNILAKYSDTITAKSINKALFEHDAELVLADQLAHKNDRILMLSGEGSYDQILQELAALRKPVDDYFDHVMVMTDDVPRRENRLLLLTQLRSLFLRVADIALLQ